MGDIMGSITDIVVDGLKYPFNDVNKYLGFGVIQVIMSALFMGAFASTCFGTDCFCLYFRI